MQQILNYKQQLIKQIKEKTYDRITQIMNYLKERLEIEIPDCGNAYVRWIKLCGTRVMPRKYLTIEAIEDDGSSQILVKNGVQVESGDYDEDLKQFVYLVPPSRNRTQLNIYMEKDEVHQTNPNYKITEDDEWTSDMDQLMTESAMSSIKKVKIDSDESVLIPHLGGFYAAGGDVDTSPKSLIIDYACQGKIAETSVEISINIELFKDIDLFLIKTCSGHDYDLLIKNIIRYNIIAMCIITIIWILGTIINILFHQKKGFDAIPSFKENFIFFIKCQFITNLFKKSENQYREQFRDDEESEILNKKS